MLTNVAPTGLAVAALALGAVALALMLAAALGGARQWLRTLGRVRRLGPTVWGVSTIASPLAADDTAPFPPLTRALLGAGLSAEVVRLARMGTAGHAAEAVVLERLLTLDPAGGMGGWHWAAVGGATGGPPLVVDGVVAVGGADGELVARDAATGADRWHLAPGSLAAPLALASGDGTVYVGTGDGLLRAFDARSGAERWRYAVGGPILGAPVVDGGRVYVGTGTGELAAVEAATGAPRWRFAVADDPIRRAPAVAGGVVYVAGGDALYAVDATTGTERWRVRRGGAPLATDARPAAAPTAGDITAPSAPAAPAVGADPVGVTDEALAAATFTPDQLLAGDSGLTLTRLIYAPGGGAIATGAASPGVAIDYAVAGTLAVTTYGPALILRAGTAGPPAPVPVGTERELGPGDALVRPRLDVAGTVRVGGAEPAVILRGAIAAATPPTLLGAPPRPAVGEELAALAPADWARARATLPPGPLSLVLRRLTLPPGTGLPAAEPPGPELISVDRGILAWTVQGSGDAPPGPRLTVRQGQRVPALTPADGLGRALGNAGDTPLVLLILALTPVPGDGTPPA